MISDKEIQSEREDLTRITSSGSNVGEESYYRSHTCLILLSMIENLNEEIKVIRLGKPALKEIDKLKKSLNIAMHALRIYGNTDFWKYLEGEHYTALQINPVCDGWDYAQDAINEIKKLENNPIKKSKKESKKL